MHRVLAAMVAHQGNPVLVCRKSSRCCTMPDGDHPPNPTDCRVGTTMSSPRDSTKLSTGTTVGAGGTAGMTVSVLVCSNPTDAATACAFPASDDNHRLLDAWHVKDVYFVLFDLNNGVLWQLLTESNLAC